MKKRYSEEQIIGFLKEADTEPSAKAKALPFREAPRVVCDGHGERMKIIRVVSDESCRVVGLRCDRCGSDSRGHNDLVENFRTFEYLQVEFVAGYWADVFNDGSKYNCDLCEQCVKTVLGPYLRCEEDYLWRQMQRFQTSVPPSDELLLPSSAAARQIAP